LTAPRAAWRQRHAWPLRRGPLRAIRGTFNSPFLDPQAARKQLVDSGGIISYVDDYEGVAEELSELAEKMRGLEERLAEVERVNARLEEAALTTARALGEVSRHWNAVYDAMRGADRIDRQISSDGDHDGARTRRE
jgi:hypothetical protein